MRFLSFSAIILSVAMLPAQIPAVMHIQGFIATNGVPYTGNADFVFQIFDQPSNGTMLWSSTNSSFPTAQALSLSGGVYNYLLGSQNPLTNMIWSGTGTFLQVGIRISGGSWSNVASRIQFLTVPYAFSAQRSQDSNPVGTILQYYGYNEDLMRSYNNNYLICDGKTIGKTNADYNGDQYFNLFCILYRVSTSGTGTMSEASNAWNTNAVMSLPDMRGRFVRGKDSNRGKDPDAASRTDELGNTVGDVVGSVQADMYSSHNHSDTGHTHTFRGGGSGGSVTYQYGQNSNNLGTATGYANITYSGGNETRPNNISVNFIIKY